MSVEKALEFMNEICKNENLEGEIEGAVSGKTAPEASAAIAEIAGQHGFEFTADEAEQVRSALRQQLVEDDVMDAELSDDDLDGVAGGTTRFNMRSTL